MQNPIKYHAKHTAHHLPVSQKLPAGNTILVRDFEKEGIFFLLPVEILVFIVTFFDIRELGTLCCLSRRWHYIADHDNLWMKVFKLEFGQFENDEMFFGELPQCWKCRVKDMPRIDEHWGDEQLAAKKGLHLTNDGMTVTKVSGGWGCLPVGNAPLKRGKYYVLFHVDRWTTNGMMIGIVTEDCVRAYPGNGNGGLSQNDESCAYYSHDGFVYTTGDNLGIFLNLQNNTVRFYRNGTFIKKMDLIPGKSWRIITSLCNDRHQLTIIKRTSKEGREFWRSALREIEEESDDYIAD
jgi:hypothetical protein